MSISFHFARASMMTTVDNKVKNSLHRTYLNVYHILIYIYQVIAPGIHSYVTCEFGNLLSLTAYIYSYIVIYVKSFESVYPDY